MQPGATAGNDDWASVLLDVSSGGLRDGELTSFRASLLVGSTVKYERDCQADAEVIQLLGAFTGLSEPLAFCIVLLGSCFAPKLPLVSRWTG